MCGYYSEKDAARCVNEMLEAVKVITKYRVLSTNIIYQWHCQTHKSIMQCVICSVYSPRCSEIAGEILF